MFIELTEIKTSSLDLPISFDNHAGGIIAEAISSWGGGGRSLNAVGAIHCQLRGLADEAYGRYLQTYSDMGKYIPGAMSDDGLPTYLQKISAGTEDASRKTSIGISSKR